MRKCIVLNNRDLTKTKSKLLKLIVSEYLQVLNKHLIELPFADSSEDLHFFTYSHIRNNSFLPSDIVQEARKDSWKMKKHMIKSGYNGTFEFSRCSIRLNKRWFRYIMTKRKNPCFKITYSPRKTFTIPIKKDRQFERFLSFLNDGWTFNNISLLRNGKIAVILDKEFSDLDINQRYVLGIDVGSRFAISIFDTKTSNVVKQMYFGKDIAPRQKRFFERRSYLQYLADNGSARARKSLKQLKRKEYNFTNTRMGQITKEIVTLAKSYNACISFENLKNIKTVKFNKKANRKISRIPYAKFKEFLLSNCALLKVPYHKIDPYHTSKWCTHCGAVNKGHHSSNYSLYICKKCKQIVNSDRKASLAIAIKSVLKRKPQSLTNSDFIQISKTRVPVNGLLRSNDDVVVNAVHNTSIPMESHQF